MHVIFPALAHDFQPKFPRRSGILRFKSDRSRVCCGSSRQRAFKLPLKTASDWLVWRATIWWLLKVETSRESWVNADPISSSISLFSAGCFSNEVPQGEIDGRAGLLILEKLLICSLLALRSLITPIVVLLPLRPAWMSLLRNSFYARPWNEDVPTERDPATESETSDFYTKPHIYLTRY